MFYFISLKPSMIVLTCTSLYFTYITLGFFSHPLMLALYDKDNNETWLNCKCINLSMVQMTQ